MLFLSMSKNIKKFQKWVLDCYYEKNSQKHWRCCCLYKKCYFITYKNSKNTLFLSMSKNILFQLKLEIDKVRTKRWGIPPYRCDEEVVDPPSMGNG